MKTCCHENAYLLGRTRTSRRCTFVALHYWTGIGQHRVRLKRASEPGGFTVPGLLLRRADAATNHSSVNSPDGFRSVSMQRPNAMPMPLKPPWLAPCMVGCRAGLPSGVTSPDISRRALRRRIYSGCAVQVRAVVFTSGAHCPPQNQNLSAGSHFQLRPCRSGGGSSVATKWFLEQ